MKAIYYLILLGLLVNIGCKKKSYPKPVTIAESPFYLKLLVDGSPLEIKAGVNDYSMFSSISLSSSNVYGLVGEFKQTTCNACPNSIKIQINDSKASSASNAIDINSVLQAKNYAFLSGNSDSAYSKTIVQFTNANGILFTSNTSLQPQSSILQVISIEDFVSDLTNKPTKKVRLKFNCTLYNGTQTMQLEGTEVVVGLVY